MQRYIIIRLFHAVIALIGVSIITFSLARLSGNPVDILLPTDVDDEQKLRIISLWGLDEPWYEQYFTFIKNATKGDFGPSLRYTGKTSMELIIERIPASFQLGLMSIVASIFLALPLGVFSAVHKGNPFDTFFKIIAVLGQSLPSFWLAIMLIWIFSVQLGWFPTSGRGDWSHYVLPAISIGWGSLAFLMRITRSAMLSVLDSEYLKLARIKGLPEWKVLWKHGFKNASIPPLTIVSGVIVGSVTGSVVVETIFAWPGIGLLAIQAVQGRDYQVLQAITLITSWLLIMGHLGIDIIYAYVDPRIRYD